MIRAPVCGGGLGGGGDSRFACCSFHRAYSSRACRSCSSVNCGTFGGGIGGGGPSYASPRSAVGSVPGQSAVVQLTPESNGTSASYAGALPFCSGKLAGNGTPGTGRVSSLGTCWNMVGSIRRDGPRLVVGD